MSELRAGAPITVAGVILIPIERMRIDSHKQSYSYWLSATKEAVTIVICEPQGPRLLNVGEEERSLDEIMMKVPELELMILRNQGNETTHQYDYAGSS